MKQQLMVAPGAIEFRDVPIPDVGPREVKIKMMRVGICGSDIHVYHGEHPFTTYPVTQGHEVSGQVVQVGAEVRDLSPDDKVTIEPQIVCGSCYPCRHDQYNLCESLRVMGFQAPGMASEFIVCEADRVTRLPESMSYDEGAMMEPLAVAVHAVRKMGAIKGKSVIVLGAGPIGNLVAQTAQGLGAAKVLITDISDFRLDMARSCGIEHTLNTRDQNLPDAIARIFGPDRADVIVDCAGNNTTMGQAIQYARKGSTIILVAVFAELATVDLALANDHELTITSSMMYRHEDYLEAIELTQRGRVTLTPLVTRSFEFEDFAKAYQFIDQNREHSMKIMIKIHDDV